MASERASGSSRRAATPAPPRRPQSPAGADRAQGVGLDQPFFDDKNRAFWILQSTGWGGYFILRSLSGFANSDGRDVRRPHAAADRDRLFADPADGVAVPPADRDASRC